MAKPKAQKPTHEEFVFWVRRPSATYTFSLQHDRRIDDPPFRRSSGSTKFVGNLGLTDADDAHHWPSVVVRPVARTCSSNMSLIFPE